MVEWLSLGIAGAALLVAVLSRLDSRKVNRIAQEANEKSAAANEIAVEANRIAVDGNKLAEGANLVARETALGAVEREHVLWNPTWGRTRGSWCWTTLARTPLTMCLPWSRWATMRPEDRRLSSRQEPGLPFASDGLAEKCIRDVREVRRNRERQRQSPLGVGFCLEIMWTLALRVKWASSLGKPCFYETKKRDSSSDVSGL